MRVLVLDDDEVDFMQMKRLFHNAFPKDDIHVFWINDPSNVELHNEIDKHDICLIDQNMCGVYGIDIIRNMTERGCLTPMILLTGEDDKAIDEKASQYGASDYLIKNAVTAPLLNRAVRFSLVQKEHEKKLVKFAYTDGLTSLANRIKFDQALNFSINAAERAQDYLAVVIIDLDDFKLVNDTYGHPIGDALLKEFSSRISLLVRKTDIVARLGGDEFGIILSGYHDRQDIVLLKDKILSVFEQPIQFEHYVLHCKGSIGIAVLNPNEKKRAPSDLIRAADSALYKAKRNGKNSYEFFDPELGSTIEKIAAIERALSSSVENEELELYFQPKVTAGDNKICGAEALLRWNRGTEEKIGPDVFIPIAEKSLSILAIGSWVIEEACKKLRSWIDCGAEPIPIAVNVSPVQIQTETFVDHIKETLERYDIDPELLELEITETALMEHFPYITERIATLSEIGCKWVIDDFGVGYSSLSRLKDLPIKKIKLDRSFVKNLGTSDSSHKICNIIILLAKELDLILVAEGVETQTQIDMLALSIHDELQGFYFSEPLQSDGFENWLKWQHHPIKQATK